MILVIGILAAIAVPKYRTAKDRALAAQVVAEMLTVRKAAFQAFSDNGSWPADAPPGVIPPTLVAALGDNYPFLRDGYTLDWDIVDVGGTVSAAIVARALRESVASIVRSQLGADAQGTSDPTSVTFVVERIGASAAAPGAGANGGSDGGGSNDAGSGGGGTGGSGGGGTGGSGGSNGRGGGQGQGRGG